MSIGAEERKRRQIYVTPYSERVVRRAMAMMNIPERTDPTILDNRTEIAIAINYGFWPVLGVDLDAPQEYDDFKQFTMVNMWHENPFHPDHTPYWVKGQLTCDRGRFEIKGFGAMLKREFTATDVYDMVRESTYPKIKPGQIVALATFSQRLDLKFVRFMRVPDRVDIHCSTMAVLEDLTREEMEAEVDSKINQVLAEL